MYATPQQVNDLEDCIFYHTIDIPGHGLIEGLFDLRKSITDYLGYFAFAGKRVLEIGPGSGFITGYLESQGAEVVAVEVSEDFIWDIVPQNEAIRSQWTAERREVMQKLKNSFWFTHARLNLKAKVYYGNAADLPDTLGKFDIILLGAILLHNRDPLTIIENCVRLSKGAIIIVEPIIESLVDVSIPVMRLVPSLENEILDTWWNFTPELLINFLKIMGFSKSQVTKHSQIYKRSEMPFFTIVAER